MAFEGIKFGADINLQKNQVKNRVIEKLAAAPAEPTEGLEYYDETKHQVGYYNGTEWIYGSTVAEATEAALGTIKLAGDIKAGTGAAPQVTNLHLAGDTAVNHKLTTVTDPTAAQDAATKKYVDGKLNGLSWKERVDLATFAALPAYTQSGSEATGQLEANANGALTVDGVAVTIGMRIFVTLGAVEKDNGIYEVIKAGGAGEKWRLLRAVDANTGALLENATAFTHSGTELADHEFTVSNSGAIVADTTAIKVIEYQSGTTVKGDGKYTTRTANVIELKPDTGIPAVPAEGVISAAGEGALRIKRVALTGDGAKKEWTLEHKLGTRLLIVCAQENAAGTPANPIELDWVPGTAETIVIKFPVAPAKGTSYFISIAG